MIELKTYICHKRVKAGKILDVTLKADGGAVFTLEVPGNAFNTGMNAETLGVSEAYVKKHLVGVEFSAIIGGYYVNYQDGYEFYSPGPSFESGYTEELIPPF